MVVTVVKDRLSMRLCGHCGFLGWAVAVGLALVLAGAPPARAATNRALLQAGQGVSALLRGQYEKAVEAYTQALESADLSDVRRANIHNDRGVAQWRLGKTKEAVDDFNKAIELFPDYAVVYNNRGNALMDLKRPDEAVKDFDRAIDLAPAYGAAYNNRGNALLAMGRTDQAYKAFAKAVELMPDNAVPLNGRGKVNTELDRPFAAMRDLNRAILLNANYSSAYRNRASANLTLERHSSAIEDLTQAIGNGSDSAELYIARARAYARLKRYRPALNDLSKATELRPESPDIFAERGRVYADLGVFNKAQEDFAKAIALAPNMTAAYVSRARTYLRMGAPQEGLTDASRALAIDPNSGAAYRVRAEIYEKLGRAGEADADYAKAATLDPAGGEDAREERAESEPLLLPEAGGEVIGEPFDDWLVKRVRKGHYVATNPRFPDLRVPLEMYGPGEPRFLEWQLLKNQLRGIGLLRYFAGDAEKGGRLEYIAVIDLWRNAVVAIEPHNLGGRMARWAWADVSVVVTDPQGTPSEIKLRQARPEPQYDEYGRSVFDDWFSGGRAPEPRRRTRPRGLFDWLFGN